MMMVNIDLFAKVKRPLEAFLGAFGDCDVEIGGEFHKRSTRLTSYEITSYQISAVHMPDDSWARTDKFNDMREAFK